MSAAHQQAQALALKAKYFPRAGGREWTFSAKVPQRQRELFPEPGGNVLTLLRASGVTIRRHVKVRAEANPFDPVDDDYLRRRRRVPRSVFLGATA